MTDLPEGPGASLEWAGRIGAFLDRRRAGNAADVIAIASAALPKAEQGAYGVIRTNDCKLLESDLTAMLEWHDEAQVLIERMFSAIERLVPEHIDILDDGGLA